MSKENKNKRFTKDEKRSGLFSLVYVYVLVILLVIGIIYSENLSNMERQTVPPALPDTTNQNVVQTIQEPRTTAPINLKEIIKPTPDLISEGKKIFTTVCVTCHGADGKGDGPAAASLNPHPRNFTSKQNWVNGPTLSGIYETLQNGIQGSAMVSFTNYTPEQRFALAHYIRSTFVPDPPKVDPDAINDLDQKYHLSEGANIPGQIPIQDAMELMEKNAKSETKDLDGIINKISSDTTDEGYQIFSRVTNNKIKAITSLNDNTNWLKNEDGFVNTIVNNVNQNGFDGKIYLLTKDNWNTLYRYMSKYF